LRTVAIYWQQQVIAENANEILEHSQEFYKRTATFSEHFAKVGTNLGKAIATFNKAAGSFQSQVMPSGRRLKGLKVTEGVAKELQEMKIIDETPRAIPLFVSEEE
ncbi:MAG: DNA recombination protein RmuC, partial [Euryarchaeota archaeon]|nr:DNA recombination protein RmuC [Euryarchaeota archaeon]